MEGALAFTAQSPGFAFTVGSPRTLVARGLSPTLPTLIPSNPGRQISRSLRQKQQQERMRCRSNGGDKTPGGGSSGESESKAVLDAFFLGKAFAEALNERIESTVGEFLSVIGQWQAEQQKQVLDFQEEVKLRAKMAKEKAALKAFEAQGSVFEPSETASDPSPATVVKTPFSEDGPLEEMLKD